MIKFIHKKHSESDFGKGKIVIYYNVSDIVLGIMLVALVAFFINDYLSHSLKKEQGNCFIYPKAILDLDMQKSSVKTVK